MVLIKEECVGLVPRKKKEAWMEKESSMTEP